MRTCLLFLTFLTLLRKKGGILKKLKVSVVYLRSEGAEPLRPQALWTPAYSTYAHSVTLQGRKGKGHGGRKNEKDQSLNRVFHLQRFPRVWMQ